MEDRRNSPQNIRIAWNSVAKNIYGVAFGGTALGFGLGLIPHGADPSACIFAIGCGAASLGIQVNVIKKKLSSPPFQS